MIVKLLNRWMTIEVQVNGFIYLSAHGWKYTWKQFLSLQNLLLVFLHLKALGHAWVWREKHSIRPRNRPRASHWRRWHEQQCCLSLSKAGGIKIWLYVHLASALAIHPILSTEPSSNKCTAVQCRATWEWIKHSAKTCSNIKWSDKLRRFCHIINSRHA